MNGKRKQHTAEVRFKVALEALKGLKTVAELALTYEVHPTLVNRWKKELQEGGRSLFGDPKRKKRETEVLQAVLYEEIGRLKFELDWLKKKLPLSNSDQGVQFTSLEFTGRLETAGIAISMDGRGRALDNVFWSACGDRSTMRTCISRTMAVSLKWRSAWPRTSNSITYNHHRPHQSLNYQTPAWVHFQQAPAKIMG